MSASGPTWTGSGALPALPFRPSEAMASVYREVESLPTLRPVAPPEGRWVRETYLPWNEGRRALIRDAMRLRREVQSEPLQPVVAAALLARILEQTASELRRPRLSDEAREAIQSPVTGLEDRALRAYESCHERAVGAGTIVDGWRRFCGEGLTRFERPH